MTGSLVLACGSGGGAYAPATEPIAKPAKTEESAKEAKAPSDVRDENGQVPERDTTAPKAEAEPPKKPPSPFHIFAEGDSDLELFAAGDTLYLVSGNLVEEVTDKGLAPVYPHEEPEKEGEWSIWGLPGYGRVSDVSGSSREQTYLTFLTDNGRIGYGILFKRQGASWKQAKVLSDGTIYAGISPWYGGRVIAMTRGAAHFMMSEPSRFAVISGPPATLPKLTPEKGCGSTVVPATYKALPSGEVLTYGSRCVFNKGEGGYEGADVTGEPMVEYFAAGSAKGTVIRLAVDPKTEVSADLETTAVFGGVSSKDLYLSLGTDADAPHLYHFDGSAFVREDASSVGRIISMAMAPDGTFWAVTSAGAVFARAPGKPFAEVSLPEKHAAWKIHVKSDGSVWVRTDTGKTAALLTTGAPQASVARAEKSKQKNDFSMVKPATAKCKTLFVMLYAFTKVTPPDYDFPLTRKALKGKTQYKNARFVVTDVGGKKFFGAFVPDLDTGRALVALVEKEVSGSKPQLVCHDPKVIRELKLNLTTGEVEK